MNSQESTDDCGYSHACGINRIRMAMTRDVNEITRHMELTIMQVGKRNLKGSRLQRISGRPDIISKYIVNHMNNWG